MSQRDLQTFCKRKCHQDTVEAVNPTKPDIPLNLIKHDALFIGDKVETNTGEHCTEGGVEK